MNLFCDMDMVLVQQTGRDGFDTMPWMPDGKILWDFIKGYEPTILSQLSSDIHARGSVQKRVWCDRELGMDVPLIVVRADRQHTAKFVFSGPDMVLIDDGAQQHQQMWEDYGGVFIHYVSTADTIEKLCLVLGIDDCVEAV